MVLFGVSALPYQTLQALAALARHTQVVLAVPNPCQFYWGDIIDGRDLLRAENKRQRQRNGTDLAQIPLEALHAHSHPLLASWGRQGRDFIRMLDEFDEHAQAEGRDDSLRIDLFGEETGETLLQQVQVAIRELRPLAEHEQTPPDAGDRSIEFHVAHSVQREVEVLHDQLLAMFAHSAETGLRPRDVVVMVPDIDTFTAAIHAVFGQYRRNDERFIPFEIGDVKDRSVNPLLVALEWLLQLPQQRCRQSEVRDLLDVPALAARFGLQPDDLATLGAWIEGAGVRWGLDQAHRAGLGLGAAGEQNAWIFGVRRMLLGYASGSGASFGGIEPYAEVGGLDAALAGSLAQLVEALLHWRSVLASALHASRMGRAGARAAGRLLRCRRRRRPFDPGAAGRRLAGLAGNLRACGLCRAGAAVRAARGVAGRAGRADPEPSIRLRRRDLLHPDADARRAVPRRVPAGHERWRLPAPRAKRPISTCWRCPAWRARATARAATMTAT